MNATMKAAMSLAGVAAMLLTSGCAAGAAPSAGAEDPHPLERTWQVTWTADELYEAFGGADNPTARDDAELNDGLIEVTFDDGTYDVRWVEDADVSCPGTYALQDDRIIMTATTDPAEWDCGDGVGQLAVDAEWHVEDGLLRLTDWNRSPEPAMDWFYAAVLGEKPLEAVD